MTKATKRATCEDDDADAAKRERRLHLLVGHLLRLLCDSNGGPLPHALPALTSQLRACGVLPRWLREVLLHRPRHFDRAFRRAFDAEGRAAAARLDGDPATQWAAQRFWGDAASDPRFLSSGAPVVGDAQPRSASRLAESIRARVGAASAFAAEVLSLDMPPAPSSDARSALPPSRYETDFQEIRQLGRGAFGRVALAVNRLDGREYAIKKIGMATHSGATGGEGELAVLVVDGGHVVPPGARLRGAVQPGLGRRRRGDAGQRPARELAWTTPRTAIERRSPRAWGGGGDFGRFRRDGNRHGNPLGSSFIARRLRQPQAGDLAAHTDGILPVQLARCARPRVRGVCAGGRAPPRVGVDAADPRGLGAHPRAGHRAPRLEAREHLRRPALPKLPYASALAKFDAGGFGGADDPSAAAEAAREAAEVLGSRDERDTGAVGTYLYTAPEIDSGDPHQSSKVDLYSAGIVFYEMLRRFSTGMERAVELGALRAAKPKSGSSGAADVAGVAPEDFRANFAQQTALVAALLAPDPSERPSASEVLSSGFLPEGRDEALEDVLRAVDLGGPEHDVVVERLTPRAAPAPDSRRARRRRPRRARDHGRRARGPHARGAPERLQAPRRESAVESRRDVGIGDVRATATRDNAAAAADGDSDAAFAGRIESGRARAALPLGRARDASPRPAVVARAADHRRAGDDPARVLRRRHVPRRRRGARRRQRRERRGGESRGPRRGSWGGLPREHVQADFDIIAPRALWTPPCWTPRRSSARGTRSSSGASRPASRSGTGGSPGGVVGVGRRLEAAPRVRRGAAPRRRRAGRAGGASPRGPRGVRSRRRAPRVRRGGVRDGVGPRGSRRAPGGAPGGERDGGREGGDPRARAVEHLCLVASHLEAMGVPAPHVRVVPLLTPPETYHCSSYFEIVVPRPGPATGRDGARAATLAARRGGRRRPVRRAGWRRRGARAAPARPTPSTASRGAAPTPATTCTRRRAAWA